MILSDIVGFRNQLEALSLDYLKDTTSAEISRIELHLITAKTNFNAGPGKIYEIEKNFTQIIDYFNQGISSSIKEINELISSLEKPYFEKSYKIYESSLVDVGDAPTNIMEYKYWQNKKQQIEKSIQQRALEIDESTKEYLDTRIRSFCNWAYPGLCIHPNNNFYLNGMVACDPLYLLDESYDLLKSSLQNWPVQYQNRVCTYLITENNQDCFMPNLPNNQFGFALVFDFFNFKPIDVIKKYLTELHELIRPGGVLAFTINDCDRPGGVRLVENGSACYTPRSLITTLCQNIGFEVSREQPINQAVTWIEVKKSGDLQTVRGGQSLAKVIPYRHITQQTLEPTTVGKSTIENILHQIEWLLMENSSIDNLQDNHYNTWKILSDLAVILNIDLNRAIKGRKFRIPVLMQIFSDAIRSEHFPEQAVQNYFKRTDST